MGCVFNAEDFDGTLPFPKVRDLFEDLADQDRYENGHSYSGGFGMATGLELPKVPAFGSYDDAYEWLDRNAQKWGPALAVRYKRNSGEEHWLVGANCSS